jgi:hypothetical protein
MRQRRVGVEALSGGDLCDSGEQIVHYTSITDQLTHASNCQWLVKPHYILFKPGALNAENLVGRKDLTGIAASGTRTAL